VNTYQEDRLLALPQQLQLLAQAGFASADVIFKRNVFAIFAATKTGVNFANTNANPDLEHQTL
jgi:hypothetical protein